ncbi:hypothetical protein [Streptomyces sp. NPDC058674]|uniref:hypothetical protein n=1 Tax=Streptomyces sp. NPDC058674 TaxID=3346592 RepID=UPI003659D3EB
MSTRPAATAPTDPAPPAASAAPPAPTPATAPAPAPAPATAPGPAAAWEITGGHPDPAETAAVMAVLAALLTRRHPDPDPPPGPAPAPRWKNTPARELPRAGTWRHH